MTGAYVALSCLAVASGLAKDARDQRNAKARGK